MVCDRSRGSSDCEWERKAALLAEIAHAEDISLEQVVAVGDGANDIPC